MKNKFSFLFVVSIFAVLILGCSRYNPLSGSSSQSGNSTTTNANRDKTLSEKTIDATVGEERIGIAECDEVVDFFAEQAKSEDDNYLTRATREYVLNKIRESFKESIKENKGDTAKMAKECKEYKKQLDKYKAEEDSKKSE